MQYYVGLDVSVKETSVCIIDKAGRVIREVKVATEPVADPRGSYRRSACH
jgi:transposase